MIDTTPSAISQFINSIKPYFSISSLVIGVMGFILGILTKFADGYIKEHFDKRKKKTEHKQNIAEEVLKICNEASSNSFRIPPRDMEHINKILTEVELIDKQMETIMNEFISSWNLFATNRSAGNMSPDDVRFAKGQLDRAEDRRKTLIKKASKMR